MHDAEVAIEALLTAAKSQEAELAALRTRHEQLKALTAGQEELAVAYRRVLRESSVWERTRDLGVGLVLGTLSSLFAAFLVGAWRRGEDHEGKPPESPE